MPKNPHTNATKLLIYASLHHSESVSEQTHTVYLIPSLPPTDWEGLRLVLSDLNLIILQSKSPITFDLTSHAIFMLFPLLNRSSEN